MSHEWVGQYREWPNGPVARTREMAHQIRMNYGTGGANFPGAKELYAAADAIEEWASEWDAQQERRKVRSAERSEALSE